MRSTSAIAKKASFLFFNKPLPLGRAHHTARMSGHRYGGGPPAARRADAAAALAQVEIPDVSSLIVTGATALVRRHPIKVSANFIGLALLFLVTGFSPSPAAEARYEAALPSLSLQHAERDAGREAAVAYSAYASSRGWFWACDAACARARSKSELAAARWEAARAETSAATARAKSELGLFSRVGITEAREQFWASFAGGAAYARRATMWDALFVGMRSMGRDEPLLQFAVQMLFRFLSNLTVGIASGVLHFWWRVVGIIRSFNPSFLGGLTFFACAILAGASFFVSAVATLFGGTALVVGSTVSVLRIAAAQQEQQQRRVRAHAE